MHISHIAIWTTRLEELRNFYITYFNGTSNEKYINPKKGFESYFISFDQGFASLSVAKKLYWNSQNNSVRMVLLSRVSHEPPETAILKVLFLIPKET